VTAPNFSTLLDDSPDHVERPKPLPQGTYTFVVGAWTVGKSSKKGTPFVEFAMRPIAAGEDVDEDALNEMGGFDGKNMRVTFYTTEDAIYRLDEFHEHCGEDIDGTTSRRQRNDNVVNAQVQGYVTHRQADQNDPNSAVFAEIRRTLPVD
jgi:hypothetical protein